MENNTNITNEQDKIVTTKNKIFLNSLLLLSLIFIIGTLLFIIVGVGMIARGVDGYTEVILSIIISSASAVLLFAHFILFRRLSKTKIKYILFLTAIPLIFFIFVIAVKMPTFYEHYKSDMHSYCQDVCRLETVRDVLKSEGYQVKLQITQADLEGLLGSWNTEPRSSEFFVGKLDQDYYLGFHRPINGDMATAIAREYSEYKKLEVKGDYLEFGDYYESKTYLFLTDKGPIYLKVSNQYDGRGYRYFLVR